jgi:hypothetical protein
MPQAKYLFLRNERSPKGFLSENNPATDATSALSQWCNGKSGRSYEELGDDDTSLTVQLSWTHDDARAGPDLDASCEEFGVERETAVFAGNRAQPAQETPDNES